MLQAVTLLPEACAGAVCSYCCGEHGDALLKCSRCKRAWYCDKAHQQQDYARHKRACRAVAPFVEAMIESMQDAAPPPASYADAQRLVAAGTMAAVRHAGGPGAPLSNDLFSCLSNTVFCRVCFKIREQLPPGASLVCCPTCLWGWCCREHYAQHAPQHAPHCAEYAAFRRLGLLRRQQAAQALAGRPPLHFPMGPKVSEQQAARALQGWEQYRRVRVPYVTDDDAWRCMSDSLAIPLTALLACTQLYSGEELAGVATFTLHLVGAAQHERQHVLENTACEELCHLLPGVTRVHVVLVGPEWRAIAPGPTYSSFDKNTCPPCAQAGCSRTYSIFRGTYEEFASSSSWTTPTLAMACNSGVGCEDTSSWARALRVMTDRALPCAFTSMNEQEAALDAAALAAAGAALRRTQQQGQRNPFGSLVPIRDMDAGPDQFYYTNGWLACFRGGGGGDAGGGGGGDAGGGGGRGGGTGGRQQGSES